MSCSMDDCARAISVVWISNNVEKTMAPTLAGLITAKFIFYGGAISTTPTAITRAIWMHYISHPASHFKFGR
jgi:hypothetical protein